MDDKYSGNSVENNSVPIKTSWRELSVHTYVKTAIIGFLFYYIYRYEINSIVSQWKDPSWSHGFLIPLFSLYFINQRRTEILNVDVRPNYLGLVFLLCGLFFYPLNKANPSGYAYFGYVSIIATLGAVVLFIGGWSIIRHLWLPVGFLLFAIPLPQLYYVKITMPMRILAAKIATVLLNLVSGVEAYAEGVVIDVIYRGQHLEPLNVAEACSGMRLLMAFVALGVAMAYLHYRPVWPRIILLVSTVPIAIFCNVVRVTTTGFIFTFGNPKYAKGIYHDLLGMLMLPLAFGLYLFLAWFMNSLFEEEKIIVPDVVIRKPLQQNQNEEKTGK